MLGGNEFRLRKVACGNFTARTGAAYTQKTGKQMLSGVVCRFFYALI